MQDKKLIYSGAIISLIFLIYFGISQEKEAKFLSLSSQWLFISVIPILLALFVGGYIKNIKGFGIELEAALKEPLSNSISPDLQAEDVIAEVSEDEKKNIEYLQNIPTDRALSIRNLVFQLNRQGYYRPDAVASYFDRLGNLEFVEVRDKGGQFICYIPIQFFKNTKSVDRYDRFDRSKISDFIDAVASGNVEQALQAAAITLRVKSNDSLVTVLGAMRREHTDMAAVLSESGRYLGPIFSSDVEKKVADAVLTSNLIQ